MCMRPKWDEREKKKMQLRLKIEERNKEGQIHGNSVAGGMGRSNKEKTAHNSEMLQRDNGRTDGRTYGQMDKQTRQDVELFVRD